MPGTPVRLPREPQRDVGLPREAQRSMASPREAQPDLGLPREPQRDVGLPREALRSMGFPREAQRDMGLPREALQSTGLPRDARRSVGILLARHGETVFNVTGRWQGQGNSPLTERGLAQARELGRALAQDAIAAVYSSDLGRAVQTAHEVALPHGLDVQMEPRLREIDVGGWTGKSGDEIDAIYPGLRRAWATTPASMRLPDGETLLEVQTRALAFFEEGMRAHADQTIVVISHGAVGQAILVNAIGGTVEDLWLKDRIDNCQISRLEWTAADGLKLIELADVRHLADVGSLQSWRTDPT